MIILKYFRLYIILALFAFGACTNSTNKVPPHIEWSSTETKISHDVYFAEYGRLCRTDDHSLLLTYHCGVKKQEWDNIALRESKDNGKTWSAARIVLNPADSTYRGYCEPDLLTLKNGKLMLTYCARGYKGDTVINHLQFVLSNDQGRTWGKPVTFAKGRYWEPDVVELPDGEIEVFFTAEAVNNKNSGGRPEQSIQLVKLSPDLINFSSPMTVDFEKGDRDGMPQALVLKDNGGILFAFEAVNNPRSPYLVWSSMKDKWNYRTLASEQNGRRWPAYTPPVWGGAPTLLQLPSGFVVMAVQTEGGRRIDRYKNWKKNTIVSFVANQTAKNFSGITYAYPDLPVSEGAYFCSLFMKDSTHVWLVSSRNFKDSHSEIRLKEGELKP